MAAQYARQQLGITSNQLGAAIKSAECLMHRDGELYLYLYPHPTPKNP